MLRINMINSLLSPLAPKMFKLLTKDKAMPCLEWGWSSLCAVYTSGSIPLSGKMWGQLPKLLLYRKSQTSI